MSPVSNTPESSQFSLSANFLEQYKRKKPNFGFSGLGETVYYRSYSRVKEDGTQELWWETVKRVVEGTYTIQKRWIESQGLEWNPQKAQTSAHEMYDRIFSMKFLPPGRGLWAMGSSTVMDRGLSAALFNCAFVSTANLHDDPAKPFLFLADMSMLGVGVGYSTEGAGTITVKGPNKKRVPEPFSIPDSREGWVESIKLLLESYFYGTAPIVFSYDKIRPLGAPIRGFGGVSGGPEPLKTMHVELNEVLTKNIGETITSTTIVDIFNIIGKAVVSGNIRRSASIALGKATDTNYLSLKDYSVNPYRESFGWASNNSIVCDVGMDYTVPAQLTAKNGEPGYIWMDNARKYSRMIDQPDNKDSRVTGMNPCSEINLESFELCNVVEVFPTRHETKEDFLRTLKFAYLYAKTVTLTKTHWPETNRVMLRNRRIGISMSGLAQFVTTHNLNTLIDWCNDGYKTLRSYDEIYSEWFAIPRSIKITTVKPSGSVSLVAGVTPGVHYPESKYYVRRMRVAISSNLLPHLKEAGYFIEPAVEDPKGTVVVEFPVSLGDQIRTLSELSIWEQLSFASILQGYWADNSVSVTITFDPKKESGQIPYCLDHYQYKLKSVSFLPRRNSSYKQMPYEEITKEEYEKMASKLKPLHYGRLTAGGETEMPKFCDSASCELPVARAVTAVA